MTLLRPVGKAAAKLYRVKPAAFNYGQVVSRHASNPYFSLRFTIKCTGYNANPRLLHQVVGCPACEVRMKAPRRLAPGESVIKRQS